MKRKCLIGFVLLIAITGGLLFLKTKIPFSYAQSNLDASALSHVATLQREAVLTPREIAEAYLYFETDYQGSAPRYLDVSVDKLSSSNIRVTLHNKSAQCDSVWQTIDRLYLRFNPNDRWELYQHEWVHKGRGRWGWTTKQLV